MTPPTDYWNFRARRGWRFSFLMTVAIFMAGVLWLRHLGGWTITVVHEGEPFFVLKEWW